MLSHSAVNGHNTIYNIHTHNQMYFVSKPYDGIVASSINLIAQISSSSCYLLFNYYYYYCYDKDI